MANIPTPDAQPQSLTPDSPKTPRFLQPPTMSEIQASCDRMSIPLILNLQEAANLIRLKPSTLKRKVSEDLFKGCVTRGKPLRFWRDRLVYRVMSQAAGAGERGDEAH